MEVGRNSGRMEKGGKRMEDKAREDQILYSLTI